MKLSNILEAALFSLFLILPDFIINIFINGYYDFTWYRFQREALATFLIGLLLSYTPRAFITGVFFVFFVFLSISALHYIYFHTYLMPYEVKILSSFDDTKDIVVSMSDIAIESILFFIAAIVLSYTIYKTDTILKPKKIRHIVWLFAAVLIIYPYFIAKKPNIYLANFTHLSYFNTLNTLYLSMLNSFKKRPHHEYKPYIVKKTNTSKPTVIMIMGESVNYKRLHLYGWDVNNTPNLDKLAQNRHFIFKKAISSSVRTICSVSSFFYNKREPDNLKLLLDNNTNIMKLAKENGYTTYWLSMQSDVSLISKVINFADYKKFEWEFKRKYDDSLLNELKKIPFNKKTFVVIHLKAIHSPYNKYVPKKFQLFSGKRGAYYNGVAYNDYIISSIISYMQKKHKNFVIYFTSDHGEMLGLSDEKGRWGHSRLTFADALVPFFYYSDKYEKNLSKEIYSHYEISKMLTKDLGYDIINPNDKNTLFLNGTEIDGSAGWIEYKKDKNITIVKKVEF
ncbi:MAG: phosphoethanolamine transferase [Epsilonproteobacteria bacterium]|nr:phosphoethanolamine transferase [Campylobacterota bacterium]